MAPGGQSGTGPTVRRMVLGAQLRRLREEAGITRAEAAYLIRSSDSKISRLELGRVSSKVRDVSDLLTMYGVNDEETRRKYLDMVEQSANPGWWQSYTDLIPNWFQDFVGLEESANRIQSFELLYVPGLLQTEDYARAVATGGRHWARTAETDRRVRLRIGRQKILTRPEAPKYWSVIDESVLRRPIGGREVMRRQIDHLLEYTEMPHISLQILPYPASGLSAEGTFTLLRFAQPELPNIIYLEHLSGALYLERLEEIELYSRMFDQLMVDAQTPRNSRELLRKARSEL